jgi:hypothetical protein
MLDAYLADVARCTTVNQFNRLHILLENVIAPAEAAALIDGVRERGLELPQPAAHWLARTDALLRANGRRTQPYARHALAEGATVYAAPGTSAERSGRTLVLAYSGDANRLMMPIALLLQHCPAERYEFVVLVDRKRSLYLAGVAGLGDDLPSTIERLGALTLPSRYRRAVSFGTSAGGLAAVWTGVALGLARAVSVGGVTPDEASERVQTQHLSTDAFDEAIRRNLGKLPEVLLVAGERNVRDNEKVLAMSALLPATRITVPGSTHHNVLYDIWNRGELDAFMAQLLGDGEARSPIR